MKTIRSLGQTLTDLLWPKGRACLACGVPTCGTNLCEKCEAELGQSGLPEALCPRCAETFGKCVCAVNPPPWELAICAHAYTGAAGGLVRALKFQSIPAAGELLASSVADAFRACGEPLPDVVTWPPMPPARKRVRGIDHAGYLAGRTAKLLGCETAQYLCRVKGQKGEQHTLGRGARQKNAEKLFQTRKDAPDLTGKTVLLMDDVMTTGATLRACAGLLRDELHAERILVAVAAKTLPKSDTEA